MDSFLTFIIGVLIGSVIGAGVSAHRALNDFGGEYSRAKYEWKLNKEKEKLYNYKAL